MLFRYVQAKDINRSESRSLPRHQCRADASCTSFTSAGFQYGTLVRTHWSSVFANAHRNVYNNFWTSYIGQNHVRSEAGRRGSVSACDSGCHHADWKFATISRPKDDKPQKLKRDMLLHNVGTHQVEEHLDVCSDDARRCAKQNELRILELRLSKRDMQVADSVSTAGPRADFMTFSTSSCSHKLCWNTCARYANRAHFVTYRLVWVCKAPSASSVRSSGRRGERGSGTGTAAQNTTRPAHRSPTSGSTRTKSVTTAPRHWQTQSKRPL